MEGFLNVVSFPSLIARLSDKCFLESEEDSCQFIYENEYVAVGNLVRTQQLRSSKALNLSVEEREFELLVVSSAESRVPSTWPVVFRISPSNRI
jgi:hypothetical protein